MMMMKISIFIGTYETNEPRFDTLPVIHSEIT